MFTNNEHIYNKNEWTKKMPKESSKYRNNTEII